MIVKNDEDKVENTTSDGTGKDITDELKDADEVKIYTIEELVPSSVPITVPYLEIYRTNELEYIPYMSPYNVGVGASSSDDSGSSDSGSEDGSSDESSSDSSGSSSSSSGGSSSSSSGGSSSGRSSSSSSSGKRSLSRNYINSITPDHAAILAKRTNEFDSTTIKALRRRALGLRW